MNDPTLNGLLNQSAGFNNPVKLRQIYGEIANLMNQQVYAVWMDAKNNFDISTKRLVPNGGLSYTLLLPQWEKEPRTEVVGRSW